MATNPAYDGARIRRLREDLGLSLDDLAARTDRHPESIRNIEKHNKRASMETLIGIADALGVSVSEFAITAQPELAAAVQQTLTELIPDRKTKPRSHLTWRDLQACRRQRAEAATVARRRLRRLEDAMARLRPYMATDPDVTVEEAIERLTFPNEPERKAS